MSDLGFAVLGRDALSKRHDRATLPSWAAGWG